MKKAARKKKESFFVTEASLAQDTKDSQVVQKDSMPEAKTPSKPFYRKRSIQIGAFLIIFIIICVILGFVQLNKLKDAAPEAGKLSNEEIKSLIAEIGDKMVLPENETPTIATVTDVSKLEGQPFFRNAKNGDKVVIYGSTKEAILYRPSIHKIISVAPINANDATVAAASPSPVPSGGEPSGTVTPSPSVSPTETPKLKVVVLNSTKTAGLARKGSALLDTDKVTISTANAQGEYPKSTIVAVGKDKKMTNAELTALVAKFSNPKPTVGNLPSGETIPEGTDAVIILGQDFADAQAPTPAQ